MQHHLPVGGVAIDVGANIGLLTLPMARCVGTQGSVLAIEPHPDNISALASNLKRNNISWVQLEGCAVGSHQRRIQLGMPTSRLGTSTGFYSIHANQSPDSIDVDVRPLALIMSERLSGARHINVLKIDVEGMEIEVLEGLAEWLDPNKIDFIMVEISVSRLGPSPASQLVLARLIERGFRAARLRRNGALANIPPDSTPRSILPTVINLVAVGR